MTDLATVLQAVDDWEPDTVAIGVADRGGTIATHGPTGEPFALASVTKPLAAYAVLVAVEHGLVHLDEPAGPDDDSHDVTVRHLLSHAGGLPSDPQGPRTQPGRRRSYSNWAYDLLGELVASRAEVAFGDYLRREVLEPLGMGSTTLEGSPARDGTGNVDDLLVFVRELLGPQLISEDLLREATTVTFEGLDGVLPGFGRQTPNDWGLGFEIRGDKSPHWSGANSSPRTFGHFGQSGSLLWVDPELGIGCASLADLDFGSWAASAWPEISDAIVAAV